MEREKRYTPSPWYKVHTHSNPDTAASLAYIAATRRPLIAAELASVYCCDGADGQQDANAHLMKASPQLLEALEMARKYVYATRESFRHMPQYAQDSVASDLELIDYVIARAYGEVD